MSSSGATRMPSHGAQLLVACAAHRLTRQDNTITSASKQTPRRPLHRSSTCAQAQISSWTAASHPSAGQLGVEGPGKLGRQP